MSVKYADTIVFVVVAAAVLIAAYGVGLLVRQARISPDGPQAQPQTVSGTTADSNAAKPSAGAGEPNQMQQPAVPDVNESVQNETEPENLTGDPNTSSENENDGPGLIGD